METNIYKERLLKLAQHLENGELGHKNFDFSCFNRDLLSKGVKLKVSTPGSCGTNGCAIGELPIIFPEYWEFSYPHSNPQLNAKYKGRKWRESSCSGDIIEDAQVFFNIDVLESLHLFMPDGQNPNDYGGKNLGDYATKEEVAQNIRDFVNYKYKNNE